jgi:Arc/MetJ-type ribon-helix-helix transcriptional regulator
MLRNINEDRAMTIHLPKDLESSVRAEVLSGHFASEDDLVAAAVRAFLRQQPQEQLATKPSGMGSIGAMHDDAELLEQITQGIMHSRETRTLRLPPDE